MDFRRDHNAFDLLRVLAACLVIVAHAPVVLRNRMLEFDPVRFCTGVEMGKFGVALFFIISGFLVSRSFARRSGTLPFLAARVLRIFPAAVVTVFVSVFAIGLLVTTVGFRDYFSSRLTWEYLANVTLFRIHYYLPGVFSGNPAGPSVNASLWTLPYEFTCYLLTWVIGISGSIAARRLTPALFAGCFATYLFVPRVFDPVVIPLLGIDFKTFTPLLLYYLAGATLWHLHHLVLFRMKWMLLALGCGLAIGLLELPVTLGVLVWPYVVLACAFNEKLASIRISRFGDFSYGLYLFAFPMQQLLILNFPEFSGLGGFICASFAAALPCAVASWYLVEKPALRLKTYFTRTAT